MYASKCSKLFPLFSTASAGWIYRQAHPLCEDYSTKWRAAQNWFLIHTEKNQEGM
jgi:hypothetical protein